VWVQSRYWYGKEWPGREAALADTFAYYREVMGPGFVRMYFEMAADQVERSLFPIAPAIHQPVWLGWGDQDDGADMGAGVAKLAELRAAHLPARGTRSRRKCQTRASAIDVPHPAANGPTGQDGATPADDRRSARGADGRVPCRRSAVSSRRSTVCCVA
jgi:hypothetical protein